ncbi:MAG: TonB-dependent receptor plug domain-containing protein, partial [Paracoccaceae bacterium]
MTVLQRLALTGALVSFGAGQPAWAQTADKDETDTFILGTIYVTAEDPQGGTSTTVTGEEAVKSGRFTLDDTLKTVPGVGVGNSGGSRNERLIFVRGFDRLQVPLSIDGIRVYLPSDNRLDFGRFLTPDLAEVQVQKGYVSVLNGPGGMGGAINLVTKQPVEPFEGTVRLGFEAGNTGEVTGRNTYLSFGT